MELQDKALDVQIRQSEMLAQKLYGQCRDSSSAFKTLTSSLRKLRNVLGEIDEALESSEDTIVDFRLVHRSTQCRAVLDKLDIAFTSWKCNSSNDIEVSVASVIRSELVLVAQDLSAALESSQAGTTSSVSSDALAVKSSQSSTTSSDVLQDISPNTNSPDTLSPDPRPTLFSDEKEVWLRPHDHPQSAGPSSSKSNLGKAEFTSQWRSLLGQADPLSMPLREASLSILEVGSPISPDVHTPNHPSDPGVQSDEEKPQEEERNEVLTVVEPVVVPSVESGEIASEEPVVDDTNAPVTNKDPGRRESEAGSIQELPGPPGIITTKVKPRYYAQLSSDQPGEPVRKPRRPPPPPPPRRSVKDLVTIVMPPSPTPTERSDELYSSTPRRASFAKAEDAVAVAQQLSRKLTDVAPAVSISTGVRRSIDVVRRLASPAESHSRARSKSLGPTISLPASHELEGDHRPISEMEQPPASNPITPTITIDSAPSEEIDRHLSKPTRYRSRRPSAPSARLRERALSTSDIEKSPALHTPTTSSRISHRRSVDEALQTHMAFIKQDLIDVAPKKPPRPTPPQNPPQQAQTPEEPTPPPIPPRPPTVAPPPPLPKHPVPQAPPQPHSTQPFPAFDLPLLDSSKVPWSPESIGRKPSADGTYYAPEKPETSSIDVLDEEYARHIVHFVNEKMWAEARSHLLAWLDSLQTRLEIDTMRRVHHLLGVIASLQGQWVEAMHRFTAVLKKPVMNALGLDDGDCAAAYWLGDIFAMLNLRLDAFLAYAIAERSTIPNHNPNYLPNLSMEQQAVQLGISKSDYEARWAQLASTAGQAPSLTDPNIISIPVAKLLLDRVSISVTKQAPSPGNTYMENNAFSLDPTKSRSNYLTHNFTGYQMANHTRHMLKINKDAFSPTSPWPMPYDPFFSIANVSRGRILPYEIDLYSFFTRNPSAKLPRPLLSNKMDYFTTSHPLPWLIITIRTVLKTLEVRHSEVANVEGTWFCCRYSYMEGKIVTTHYFQIKLVRLHLRGSYGVDIVSDALGAARLLNKTSDYVNGVHTGEAKRWRKIIRECLEEAAKERKRSADTPASTSESDLELVR